MYFQINSLCFSAPNYTAILVVIYLADQTSLLQLSLRVAQTLFAVELDRQMRNPEIAR